MRLPAHGQTRRIGAALGGFRLQLGKQNRSRQVSQHQGESYAIENARPEIHRPRIGRSHVLRRESVLRAAERRVLFGDENKRGGS